jgi:hypothetical protein
MDQLSINWQKSIIGDCENKLSRVLSSVEREFIESRGGCIALEFIQDTVRTATPPELVEYLNSESNQ